MYYKNRGKCEYNYCNCVKHILKKGTEICSNCNHGSCWHKKLSTDNCSINSFLSPRKMARTGFYVFIINQPTIQLPQTNNFCKCIDDLPA